MRYRAKYVAAPFGRFGSDGVRDDDRVRPGVDGLFALGDGDYRLGVGRSTAPVAAQLQARHHPRPYIADTLHSPLRDALRVVLSRQTTDVAEGSYTFVRKKIEGRSPTRCA